VTRSGTAFEQGAILVVPFPFSDLSGIKQRPVLVISSNDYNTRSDDIVTCGITSNLKASKYSVLIDNSNLEEGKIPAKSRIKADKIFTLEKSIIKKKIAKIDTKTLEKIKAELLDLFEITGGTKEVSGV
jgi:mRNA interferase MazF